MNAKPPRKALILAAGVGSRLAPLTDTRPKCLVHVGGTPILIRQLQALKDHGVADVTLVAGYRAGMVTECVAGRFPDVSVLVNPDYASTNNLYSAYLARRAMGGEPFLLLNGDVCFDASILQTLLACGHENAIACEAGAYRDESMKITAIQTHGPNGPLRVTHIAKDIPPSDALGVSIDVYKLSGAAGASFFAQCADAVERRGIRSLWSETALDGVFADHCFAPCPVDGRWVEIDDLFDLARAQRLFGIPGAPSSLPTDGAAGA